MIKGQHEENRNRIRSSRPGKTEWHWLVGQMGPYRGMILAVAALGLVSTVMKILSSVASKYVIDALAEQNTGMLWRTGFAMALLILGELALQSGSSVIGARLHIRVQNRLQGQLFAKILRTSWQALGAHSGGDLLNRLNSDIGVVSNGVIGLLPGMAMAGIRMLCVVGILFCFHPMVAVIALVGTPLTALASRLLLGKLRRLDLTIKELGSKMLSFQENTLDNLTSIKTLGMTGAFCDKLGRIQEEYGRSYYACHVFRIGMRIGLSALNLAVTAVCLGWGVYQLWLGTMSYGSLVLLLQLISMLRGAFSGLISQLQQTVTVLNSVGRVMELERLPDEVTQVPEGFDPNGDWTVSLEKIACGYRDHAPVLRDLDFTAAPGEMIAVTGASGCGKTTLLRLLLGLLEPVSGEAELRNGKGDAYPITAGTRGAFSYVPQENSILTGSVGENLRLVAPNATDEQLRQALEIACAWDYVKELPGGLEYRLEGGRGLSEGQCQRLAIARALLRKAPILLLDEATSGLDEETERKLLENIRASGWVRTCILVTHRTMVARGCDRVYQMRQAVNPEVPDET